MKKIILLFSLLASFFLVSAQSTDTRKKQFNLNKSSLAIDGYDPVAYFTQQKAIEGKKEFSIVYEGVSYRFSSEQNRQLFKASPAKYEPQYGGWCAYAMGANGEKVEVDPETFKVLDGKLYLFYNKLFNNTLSSWNKNESALKQKADNNWLRFVK